MDIKGGGVHYYPGNDSFTFRSQYGDGFRVPRSGINAIQKGYARNIGRGYYRGIIIHSRSMATQQLAFHFLYKMKWPLPWFLRMYSPNDYPGKFLTRKRVVIAGLAAVAMSAMGILKRLFKW